VKPWLTSLVLNLLVPGTGLIVLGRPWMGLALTGCFLLGAEVGILALLVVPAVLPFPVAVLGLAWAATVWFMGQILLIRRVRLLRSAELPRQMAILRRLTGWALNRGDYAAARSAIAIALSLDDSDPACQILRARLLSLTGKPASARRAWLLARRLDLRQEHEAEIDRHLDMDHPG
jgi:hypothetical protein